MTNPYLTARPRPGLRLFCFHHAGGAASAFAGWADRLGPGVSVLPVQLPGREGRLREPRFRDMTALVDVLADALAPALDGPFAFYGHSMGALVAHDLTQRLLSDGRPLPRALLVGGYPAPDHPAPWRTVCAWPDDRLARWMVDIGGMSAAVLDYPDWVSAAATVVRDDLSVCASHRPRTSRPLPLPIHVFTGADDPLVHHDDLAGWAAHTAVSCAVHVVRGGHFFLRDSAAEFLDLLAGVLPTATSMPLSRH